MIDVSSVMTVKSAQGNYSVEGFRQIEDVVAAVGAIRGAFVIIDRNVSELYARALKELGHPFHRMVATEEEKTIAGVERALLAMQSAGCDRTTTVVGVGGGIVQDVSTLAAHLWYRGVAFAYVPTTLLSMADSCIGAKSAVNLGNFKNQIGTFQSPKRVLLCERFAETLTDDDIRSGYGEIVKLAIIGSREAYTSIRRDVEQEGFRGPILPTHIRTSLEIKRHVIEIDEYERDERKTLNYGHTFGHALESVTENRVPHGLAVAWGVDVANYIASRRGLLDEREYVDIHDFLRGHFAFAPNCDYDAASLINAMRRDKKAAAGRVTLILPAAVGDVRLHPTTLDSELEGLLESYVDHEDIFPR